MAPLWSLLWLLAAPAGAQDPAAVDAPPAEATVPPPAAADPLDELLGKPVAQVALEAPRGGLPRESLEPLLRVREGETLRLDLVRQDIALLIRAGEFAAVEVDAEPWVLFDEQGEPQPAVRLVYRVYPPVRVQSVRVLGEGRAARRVAAGAHELGRGEAFFARRDAARVERRVHRALAAEGWPQAEVELRAERLDENRARILLRVVPGPELRLRKVVLAGSLPLHEDRVRRALRRVGLRPGRRVTDQDLREGRDRLRALLAAEGWYDARVNLLLRPAGDDEGGGQVLAVLGEAGPRTQVLATGAGAPPADRLAELLALGPGSRFSEGLLEDARQSLRRHYQERGWYQARIDSRVYPSGEDRLVVFEIERGHRHRLRRIEVDGARVVPAATVEEALREAVPEGYGRGRLVDGAEERAVRALQELYRGQGLLDARVRLSPAEPIHGARRGRLGAIPMRQQVVVEEGRPVILRALSLSGGDEALAARVREASAAWLGERWRPAELEALRLELAARLRDEGYLGSDVRLYSERRGEEVEVRLVVESGTQARLRSVVVQGNRRTRRAVIERELAVQVGSPVGPAALEETRRRLYELDLFRVVDLELVGEEDRARDLLLRLSERPPVLVELSGGLATDRGAQVRARAAHRNLGGRGQRLSALGQAGFSWLGDGWTLDTAAPTWKAALRYEAPNLPARGQRLVADVVLNETLQEPTFRTAESGASLGVKIRLGARSEAMMSYGGRLRWLEDIDPGAFVEGDPWLQVLGLDGPTGEAIDLSLARRVVSGPEVALVLDRRDDPLDPRQGWRASGLLQLSDGLFGAPTHLRGEGRAEGLLRLGGPVLALHGHLGLGLSTGTGRTLGVEERFYLGGTGSLRGFRPESVGPANLVGRSDPGLPEGIAPFVDALGRPADPTRWVSTGGDLLLAGGLELRLPLSSLGLGSLEDSALVGFLDLGRVGFLSPAVQPTSRLEGADPLLRYGLGGGLRQATALGPVSLLLGINPAPLAARGEPSALVTFTLGDL